MPLPPALLKRLANRGIVDGVTSARNNAGNEEIIAEDYDDVEDPSQYDVEPVRKPQSFWIERMKRRIGETNATGYKGCPNKYNMYHKCSVYCMNRWGDGILQPKTSYIRRRNRLLKMYPLPKNWLEVYDYGCAVHYYWNTTDDMVSWLPPGHPKSQPSKCAAVMRRELEESQAIDAEAETMTVGDIQKLLDESDAPPNWRQTTPSPEPIPPPRKKVKSRDLDKAVRQNRSKKHPRSCGADDPLDPMDPAAYSDIPRGKWSDGLTDSTSAKSGVDPTTSGTLFQMRPYPSPGDVLQRNADADRKTPRRFSPRSE